MRARLPFISFLVATIAQLLPSPAPAAVILIIDITDPAHVTFTSTSEHAENSDVEESFLQEGFTLIDFFRTEPGTFDSYSFDESDLYSPGGAFEYTTLLDIDFTSEFTFYNDLNISGSGFSYQDFSTAQPAFTGSAVANLTAWIASLPISGTMGNIFAGDGLSYTGPRIGQYQVVPEPSAALLVLGAAAVAHLRRRSF